MSDVMNKSLSRVWSELGYSERGDGGAEVHKVDLWREWKRPSGGVFSPSVYQYTIKSTAVLNIWYQESAAISASPADYVTASLTASSHSSEHILRSG